MPDFGHALILLSHCPGLNSVAIETSALRPLEATEHPKEVGFLGSDPPQLSVAVQWHHKVRLA